MNTFHRRSDPRKPHSSQYIATLERQVIRHPRRFINGRIIWIMSYLTILINGLFWFAKGWKAEEWLALVAGSVLFIAGVAGVAVGFLHVNWAMKRLETRIASDSALLPDSADPADSASPAALSL